MKHNITFKPRLKSHNKTLKKSFSKTLVIPPQDEIITATIRTKDIAHNLNELKKMAKTDIMPVLKANAYGHGLAEIAKIVRKLGIKHIGVATLGEAILLRNNGDKGRILGWLYDIDGNDLKDALKLDIDIAICDETIIPKFIKMIPRGKIIKVTLFVDTGINRAGINYDKAYQAFIDINECKQIELVGMMSHLVCSEIKNSPIVNEQLRKFRDLRKRLADINIIPPLVHIANTTGCVNYDVSDFTLSRAGRGIHGIINDKPDKRFKLTMSVTSNIIQLKDIEKGQGIGYNWKYKTPKKMRVAIVPIGYADILPRNASNKLYVYINGTKRKVLGLISMDQIVVEGKAEDKIMDTIFIFGNGTDCPQTIFNISKNGKSTTLEIVCHAGGRINRVYV